MATEGDVLLVGSLPFDSSEEAFQGAAAAIGDYVQCLPDGEFGRRQLWVGYLPAVVYSANPALVVASASNPHDASSRAEPRSHGFGITNSCSRACRARNRARRSSTTGRPLATAARV